MLRRVALVRTDFSEECIAFIHRSVLRLQVTGNVAPSSPILFTLMIEAICSPETSVLITATQRNIPEGGILQDYMSLRKVLDILNSFLPTYYTKQKTNKLRGP
jgi:hypothetical protein